MPPPAARAADDGRASRISARALRLVSSTRRRRRFRPGVLGGGGVTQTTTHRAVVLYARGTQPTIPPRGVVVRAPQPKRDSAAWWCRTHACRRNATIPTHRARPYARASPNASTIRARNSTSTPGLFPSSSAGALAAGRVRAGPLLPVDLGRRARDDVGHVQIGAQDGGKQTAESSVQMQMTTRWWCGCWNPCYAQPTNLPPVDTEADGRCAQ